MKSISQIVQILKPHLLAMGIFLVVLAAYFSPQLNGKVVEQGDIIQGMGMAQETYDYEIRTNKVTLWTNAMFGGMPTYQISSPQKSNWMATYVERAMQLFIKAPIGWFFVAALCFYILMMVMGVQHWLAIIGGLAFSLSTNSMLLYAAGHTSKFRAISYIPLIIAGVYLLLQKKKWFGGSICFLIGLALSLSANHFQMTFYFLIGMLMFMIIYLGFAIKNKEVSSYMKAAGLMVLCGVLAIGPSFSKIYTTLEYAKDTMRGVSELKEEANKRNPDNVTEEGLDWDYAMRWSNAPRDLFGIFIPGAVGGSSQEFLKEGDEMVQYFGKPSKSRPVRIPLYWGGGESTDGPTYFGAVIFFLFILSLLVIPTNGFKYAIIGAFAVVAMLSLGKYFESFNRIFFEHFPKYSNFRAHNSAMGVVSAFFPILAIVGASMFFSSDKTAEEKLKMLKISGGITLGLALIYGYLGAGFFDFSHAYDEQYRSQFKNPDQYDNFIDALRSDRISLLHSTTLRTVFLVLLAAGSLWMFIKGRIKASYAIIIIGVLAVADLLLIDKKYLNEDNFMSKKKYDRSYSPRQVDMQIMEAEPLGRGYYRVLDFSINTFSSSNASYYHNTVGGYSAVKMQRIQDLIDSSFSKEINFEVLNMFNTKYIIDREERAQPNVEALGNAWFIDTIQKVSTATDELAALNDMNTRTTTVLHDTFDSYMGDFIPTPRDSSSTSTIRLTEYEPNRLVYKCNSDRENFVVFSEMWYGPDKGWVSTIDGKEVEHIRANYLLRGMKVPTGESEIVFEFNPQTYVIGERVSLASSILILLLFMGWLYVTAKPILRETKTEKENS
jgi:hypothetical protein